MQHLPLRYEIVVVGVGGGVLLLAAALLLFVAHRPQIGSIMVKMHDEEEEEGEGGRGEGTTKEKSGEDEKSLPCSV